MKLRYKILYMSFGAGLVVLGMMLNSLVSGDAEAQGGVKDGVFRYITCETLFTKKGILIKDGYKERGFFGLQTDGSAMLEIYGDDGKTQVAYLGGNPDYNGELNFFLQSKTGKKGSLMAIDENGGIFQSRNKMGESVVRIGVHSDGGGLVDLRDKFGYRR